MSAPRGAVAVQSLVRAGYGAAQALAPGRSTGAVLRRPAGPRARRVARLLGTRHLVQSLISLAWPRRGVLVVGVGVDGLHAASMVLLALVSCRWRRAALVEAGLAASFTVAGVRAAGRASGVPG